MNIYLDIDGVILGPESPKKGIDKLLKYLLKTYPDNTYWLTAHCKGGINRCGEWLRMNSDVTPKVEKEEIKKNLLRYCELDTWAMVRIWQELIRETH